MKEERRKRKKALKSRRKQAPPETEETAVLPRVRIVSLGCAKNFVDTEVAAGALLCAGFGLTADEEEADILWINTCAFLKSARKETESVIRSAEKWKGKDPSGSRRIIVSGCIVEWDEDHAFRSRHPAVDLWIGIDSSAEMGEIVSALLKGEVSSSVPAVGMGNPCTRKQYLYSDETPRLQLTAPHYAYVKIADGCDNRCAYCMIPDIRGGLRSRTSDSVEKEARNLIANGVRELILIAQDTSAFGREKDGRRHLSGLLRRLDRLDGDFLLRLMYLHPAGVDEDLLSAMAENRHLIRCIEMPLQHISDPVLQAMRRRISEQETRALVHRMTRELGFSLRSTFLTGFPGETEQDHEKLLDFVREVHFERLGVFAYSREPGTPAASLPDQVPTRIAERRRGEIMRLQADYSLAANRALIGREIEVILDEKLTASTGRGRTLSDAPDIDNTVSISSLSSASVPGDLLRVKVKHAVEYELSGIALREGGSPELMNNSCSRNIRPGKHNNPAEPAGLPPQRGRKAQGKKT